MPKKFIGENTKATAAKLKKQKAKEEEEKKKALQLEEEKWKDISKLVERKLKKKEEEEKKHREFIQKKAELKDFLKKESDLITKGKIQSPQKLTRAKIDSNVKIVNNVTKKKTELDKNETHLTASLIENTNTLSLNEETARTINEAISVLTHIKKVEDRHPEKRLKAAYKAFEEKRLKELKAANPTLKLSQLKQMVFKEWQKKQMGSVLF